MCNFYYTSSEKNNNKKQTIPQSWKFNKIILTKKNYKCVHCVNLSVNLFGDTCQRHVHCPDSQQISYIILRNQVIVC